METLAISLISRTLIAACPSSSARSGRVICGTLGSPSTLGGGDYGLGSLCRLHRGELEREPPLGALAGIGAGALLAAVHALVSVSFRANQTVSGLAATMVAHRACGVIGKPFVGKSLASKSAGLSIPGPGRGPLSRRHT